jgi:hypothetical protein
LGAGEKSTGTGIMMEKKNILTELRSDEVQDILTRPPSAIIRWGITVIFGIFCMIFLVSWIIRYPEIITADCKISLYYGSDKVYMASLEIPQQHFSKIHTGQKVLIKLDAYADPEFGSLLGEVIGIPDDAFSEGVFIVNVRLTQGLISTHRQKLIYKPGMTATAEVTTAEKRLLEKMGWWF